MSTLGHGQGPGHATLIPPLRDFTLATWTRYRIFSSSCRLYVQLRGLIAWKNSDADVFSSVRGENEQFRGKCVVPVW